jgi:hypothetical protein
MAALGVPDSQHAAGPVDILLFQAQSLADAQARAVQQSHHGGKRPLA